MRRVLRSTVNEVLKSLKLDGFIKSNPKEGKKKNEERKIAWQIFSTEVVSITH